MRLPSPLHPGLGIVVGLVGVGLIALWLASFDDQVTRATPELLLVVPVVVAALVGGRLASLVVAIVAAVTFAFYLPPIGSPSIRLSEDVGALVVFLVVAVVLGGLVGTTVLAEQRRHTAEAARAKALEEVDQQRRLLLRSVSHDLRTPLTTIRAVATDLRAGTAYSTPMRTDLLGLVIDEADRLDRIVGNLLSLNRIEAGGLHPDLQPVDLNELVQACASRLQHLTRGVHLELVLQDDLPPVPADFTQIDQVVTNLVENAVRHTPPGSSITIRTTSAGGEAHIEICDEGEGVDPRVLTDAWEPPVAGSASSTGLGLLICRAILGAHGGRLSVRSEPGQGACFSASLPIRSLPINGASIHGA